MSAIVAGEGSRAAASVRPARLVWGLAAAQLVSWGSLYYSFIVVVTPMELELGWSKTVLNGAPSLGLLVTAVALIPVGRWLDRHGGRGLMTAGSLAGGLLLVAWSQVESLAAYYAIWAAMGLVQSAVFYEAAFAVVVGRMQTDYRRAITSITLVAGLAGTVFVPTTQLLVDAIGWRLALVVLALLNWVICVTLHAITISPQPPRRVATPAAARSAPPAALRAVLRARAYWALAASYAAYSAASTALMFHIVPLLLERGFATATVVASVALIGPMQVAGRLALLGLGERATARGIGTVAGLALPACLVLLIAAPNEVWAVVLFVVIYGAGNGGVSIMRGTIVPELFSRNDYATISGALSSAAAVSKAVGPFAAAALWTLGGYMTVLWVILGVALLGVIAFLYASRRANPA